MVSPQPNPLAALTPGDVDQQSHRDFHFAVTWVTLFAHLDLVESTGPRRIPQPAATRALVPVLAAAPRDLPAQMETGAAAWEMVVPKMVRTGSGTFTPAEASAEHGEAL